VSSFRILMFARYLPPEYSGAASQALLLARHLRERGHEVEFVSPAWKGTPGRYRVDGFQVTAVRVNLGAVHQEFSVWRALSAYLWRHRHQVDILHGQGAYYTQSIVGPLGRLLGKPSLVKASLANDDLCSLSGSNVSGIHRRFLDMIDAYVAISADLEQEFLARGLKGERICRIPNGVDTQRFRPATQAERQAAAASLGLPTDRPIALYVGVFDERKRIEWLAERWVESNGLGTGAMLLAVGPTSREPYGAELRGRLDALAAAHPGLLRVHAHAEDIAPYYRASQCFVFPSSNEGLPNALLEAMASGLPAAATLVSGSNELVRDLETGHSFAVDDAEGLGRALAAIQGEAGRAMGERARRLVQDGYAIESIAARYEDLYRMLSERAAVRCRRSAPGQV
jgi:glycosyltransferase involved in cell wall biosynthesis